MTTKGYRPNAVAYIKGGALAPNLIGEVQLFQKGEAVLLTVEISNLPKSKHGFFGLHIHEGGSCMGEGFSNTGGHFNPAKQDHPSHAGDLPPLLSCNGKAYMCVTTDRFTVREIAGKTVVIHSLPDDFRTQPSGNAGEKIACGVIRKI